MVTKGQAAVGIVGTGATAGFLTYVAYKNNIITLPKFIADLFRVPQKAETPADKESSATSATFKTKEDCETHGFSWWAEKQACVYVQHADPTVDKFEKKWGGDEVVWTLEKPLAVTMVTYQWKLGGKWRPLDTGYLDVYYKSMDGVWHHMASSGKTDFGSWSTDNSTVINDKVTAIKWKVSDSWWHDADVIKASLM